MMWKYFIAWFPMIILAVANGIVREAWYKPLFGDLFAHQISTGVLLLVFSLYFWALFRKWRPHSATQAWTIGLMWLVMTVAFEFGFGHFIAGHPWSALLHDYNLLAGRVWLLIPLWVTLAPYCLYRRSKGRPTPTP